MLGVALQLFAFCGDLAPLFLEDIHGDHSVASTQSRNIAQQFSSSLLDVMETRT